MTSPRSAGLQGGKQPHNNLEWGACPAGPWGEAQNRASWQGSTAVAPSDSRSCHLCHSSYSCYGCYGTETALCFVSAHRPVSDRRMADSSSLGCPRRNAGTSTPLVSCTPGAGRREARAPRVVAPEIAPVGQCGSLAVWRAASPGEDGACRT